MRRVGLLTLALCLLLAVTVGPAMAWWKLPNPPDQDKAGVPPGPPNPNDRTCWLATASNMMAGAGYNGGNPAGIYATLCNNFGMNVAGQIDVALNWYIANWPNPPYTVVTRYVNNLTPTFIAQELRNCQFVGIEIFPMGEGCDHALTAWGDEQPANLPMAPATLDLADSDRDVGAMGIDTYNWLQVAIGGNPYWTLQNYYGPGNHGALSAVVTLCPVPEPSSLMALAFGVTGLAAAIRRRKI